ncbi:unnamed protein product [Caenorhabditis angaria]|uniref:Uncharacterized protein n=1 Tax=Caenorhabditis angaria TaxID=860376 RepID=A0A9P1I569_9PELO|nr:unnamed protein product [Caenorhabditis angaria]
MILVMSDVPSRPMSAKEQKVQRFRNIAKTFSPFVWEDPPNTKNIQSDTPAPSIFNFWTPQPQSQQFQFAPATTIAPFTFAPFTLPTSQPPGPTLAPFQPTTASPKLLAHNTARMIREIASFSDGGKSRDQDFGAVQTLMQAFFESMASPMNGGTGGGGVANDAPVLRAHPDGTEMGANREFTNKLFESDMVLTVPQMKAKHAIDDAKCWDGEGAHRQAPS